MLLKEGERERDYGVVVGIFCAATTLGHMIVQTENCSFFYQGGVFIWVKQEHVWNAPVQDLCHEVVEGSSNAMWHSFWMVLMTLHWWPAALQRSLSSTKDPGRLNRNCSTVFQHRCAYLEKRNLTLETRGWLLGWLPGLRVVFILFTSFLIFSRPHPPMAAPASESFVQFSSQLPKARQRCPKRASRCPHRSKIDSTDSVRICQDEVPSLILAVLASHITHIRHISSRCRRITCSFNSWVSWTSSMPSAPWF